MTPLEDVFMLEKSVRLNFQTMLAIYKSGVAALAVGRIVHQNVVQQGVTLLTIT
jgi:hypothetical protein